MVPILDIEAEIQEPPSEREEPSMSRHYITKRREEVLEFVGRVLEREGHSPTVREIMKHFGLRSSGTVHTHLVNLELSGFIQRQPGVSRGISLTAQGKELRRQLIEEARNRARCGDLNLARSRYQQRERILKRLPQLIADYLERKAG